MLRVLRMLRLRTVDDMDLVIQDPDRSRTYQDVTDEDARPPIVPLRAAGASTPQIADQDENSRLVSRLEARGEVY